MSNKLLITMVMSSLLTITGCGYAMDANKFFKKQGYTPAQVQEDLESCDYKKINTSIPLEASYTETARLGFCLRDKGYTTDDGLLRDPGCSVYKQETGKVLPICAANGVY